MSLDWYILPQADTVSSVLHLVDRDMVRESISEMKNRQAAGPPGVVSKMKKKGGESGVDLINDLLNQIIVGVIPIQRELSAIVNCYKWNCDSLETGNYRGLIRF